jgi:hypothetical protein
MWVEEAPLGPRRSHFLHVEHDNSDQRQQSREGEYLAVGQPVHFDVGLVRAVGKVWYVRFDYSDMAISNMSPVELRQSDLPAVWRLRFQVSGWTDYRDVAPHVSEYLLRVDTDGTLTLQPTANSGIG